MHSWESITTPNTLDWLLEKSNPSVRYLTLVDILGFPETERDVMESRNNIMNGELVSEILSKQNDNGYWEKPESFYKTKYKGTVWQLIILAELEANGEDERIRNACEFILEKSQDSESGGFSIGNNSRTGSDEHLGVIPCLTGNMLWSLIKFGYLNDPRVEQGLGWITTYQRFDDGIMQVPKGWPYANWEPCWGKHSCHMGVVKSLKALSEIPPEKRTAAVKNTIEQGVEYLLKHHIHKRSHNLRRVSKYELVKFGFPLMYQTDALEILGILTKLGYNDKRMQEALELVISKQDKQGRWKLENTYNHAFHISIEQKDKVSKWITLHALRMLKRLDALMPTFEYNSLPGHVSNCQD
ncbi:nitrogen fixation protein NifH [bacterium]|nr:nitrogen fixation protein NifH [bacterium]